MRAAAVLLGYSKVDYTWFRTPTFTLQHLRSTPKAASCNPCVEIYLRWRSNATFDAAVPAGLTGLIRGRVIHTFAGMRNPSEAVGTFSSTDTGRRRISHLFRIARGAKRLWLCPERPPAPGIRKQEGVGGGGAFFSVPPVQWCGIRTQFVMTGASMRASTCRSFPPLNNRISSSETPSQSVHGRRYSCTRLTVTGAYSINHQQRQLIHDQKRRILTCLMAVSSSTGFAPNYIHETGATELGFESGG